MTWFGWLKISPFLLIVLLLMSSATTASSSHESTTTRRPRRIYFGSMVNWNPIEEMKRTNENEVQLVASRRVSRHHSNSNAELQLVVVNKRRRSKDTVEESNNNNNNSFWPPWPFSLLTQQHNNNNDDDDSYEQSNNRNNAAFFWIFFKHNLRVGIRQMQHVGSQLWFHLPPATPPLILLGFRPVRRTVVETLGDGMEEIVTKTVGPAILTNPFVRRLTVASICAAILSWSHSELNRVRKLQPLPLPEQYREISKAILPPFLPEYVEPEVEFLKSMESKLNEQEKTASSSSDDDKGPKIKRHLQQLYDVDNVKTFRATITEWRRMRQVKKLESEKIRRSTIADELIALQALKKRANKRRKQKNQSKQQNMQDELGYALVTGASRGIGRAIAVELARWEVPLILVARDVDRLTSLANDIEACYGVRCCVLSADLSQPDAAERVHRTTKNAGLKVDILVNNAGVAVEGECVEMTASQIQQMLHVNVMSVATLNHLYGKDMKERARGRILVVSSVNGCVEAGPRVAVYSGTKAFEKSLAMSMAKELEPYGVGVTCLLPGAVRGTAFRSRSGADEALCWKLPFYAKEASTVASLGVRAMLEGDVECVPGWQNRAFVKVIKPILPQRLTTLVVETAWSPLKLTMPTFRWGNNNDEPQQEETKEPPVVRSPTDIWSSPKRVPRLLNLPEQETSRASETDPADVTIVAPGDSTEAPTDSDDEQFRDPLPLEDGSGEEFHDAQQEPTDADDFAERLFKALANETITS